MKKKQGKAILVIEDDADTRRFTTRVLELEGYRVLAAEDGGAGLRMMAGQSPDLVLLDLQLPDCDGLEILKAMKGRPELSATPVVVFTASAGVSRKDEALALGASAYLVKPLSAAELPATVNRVLRRRT